MAQPVVSAEQLRSRSCAECRPGTPALDQGQIHLLEPAVPDWEIQQGRKLHRGYKFPDFKSALAFVNRVGELAERQGHHPDVSLGWGHVEIDLSTHTVKGLSENDFILAAQIDAL